MSAISPQLASVNLHVTAYRFFSIPESKLAPWQAKLSVEAQQLGIKGTIVLSPEGINLALSGSPEKVAIFKALVDRFPGCAYLSYQESFSKVQPFKQMLVKIKQQIVPCKDQAIAPSCSIAPYLAPEILCEWLTQRREVVLVDVRNYYEVQYGSFANAICGRLQHFRDFATWVTQIPQVIRDKTVVTFCTGGIRCEKASVLLLKEHFQRVYQLQGGLLNYFRRCGGQYYRGHCFVFDARVAVDSNLDPLNDTLFAA